MPPSAEPRAPLLCCAVLCCAGLHAVSPGAAPKGKIPIIVVVKLLLRDVRVPPRAPGVMDRYLREHLHQGPDAIVVTRTSMAANCIVQHNRRYLAPRPSPHAIRPAAAICVLFASYRVSDIRGTRDDHNRLLSCYRATATIVYVARFGPSSSPVALPSSSGPTTSNLLPGPSNYWQRTEPLFVPYRPRSTMMDSASNKRNEGMPARHDRSPYAAKESLCDA
ncbi:hypothetical protein P171DRAFT_446715 [Karstenula rhodostoma CBS 690.94]|uniref:Secreted protein n=1 Tax=Karstenula rhodostoma CBS 690.94 TaxID=1392251 RepID=A0A9P4UA53_9PLEO|nr:hypothetical protein P171DRAFT_446715 [Karstenula rhodostoma CBS 690.94]